MNIPNHVAIILDGNGRWAKAKGMPRNAGHIAGAKTVEDICEVAHDLGIKYLTVYAFSTENWNRPKDEVDALMKLLRQYMKNSLQRASKNNMCVRVIGDKTRLNDDIRLSIEELEEATKDNTGLHFTIAINYGGRDEIRRAVTKLAKKVEEGVTIAGKGAKGDVRGSFSKYADLTERAIHVQKTIIRKLSARESCVIIGRSADYILKEQKPILRVFIYSSMDVRIKNVMKSHNLSEEDAKLLIVEKDKRYHKRHMALTGSNRGDRHNRDLLIDSALLGVDGTAKLIEELANTIREE